MTQHSKGRSGSKVSVLRAAAPQPSHFKPRGLVRALAACSMVSFWTGGPQAHAQALPTGMNTVAGQVTARTNGNALTVTNSPNAIINWKSFSIGAQNSVRFEQANASSQVLNRVTGKDPSAILGSLNSNGRVWLLNQNGVLFGQGARIDVAGLVASTLNISDTNWLTGRYQLASSSAKAADVINQGELRSSLGGQIALLGGSVRNEGVIDAPGGQVLLAAGSSFELLDSATPNVSVKVSSTPGEVVNLGRLSAAGGRVDIHAGIVNQDGIVRADALERGPAGEVVMRASANLNLAAGSVTAADGGSGGRLALEGDQSKISGQVSALGADGKGGQIKLLGREVGLMDAARIDASGRSGGGEVLVGGGLQGRDPSVPNAQAVYFGPNANISANAIESGDGGRVILWSDKATRAFGSLSARGGATGGDGGFIETSGGWLDARPLKVDTSAPHGRTGTWLLDPYDITISDTGTDSGFDPDFTATGDSALILTSTIEAALGSGTQVVVSTGGTSGTQAGDITMSGASINVAPGNGASLTLIADGSIFMENSSIATNGVATPITFRAGRSGNGYIAITSSSISSFGGDIALGGFTTTTGPNGAPIVDAAVSNITSIAGVDVDSSTLAANTGNISIRGASQADNGRGVNLLLSNLIGTDIQVQGRVINSGSTGVEVSSSSLLAERLISIEGQGDTRGVAIGGFSPLLQVVPDTSTGGSLRIVGESLAASSTGVYGVDIDGTGLGTVPISSFGPDISIVGYAAAPTGTGIRVVDNLAEPTIQLTGGAALTIGRLDEGSGATVLDTVRISGSNGPIRIAGKASGSSSVPGVTITGSSIETGGVIAVSSNRQTTITDSTLSTVAAGVPLSVESEENISVDNSTLLTNGGDIMLAGPLDNAVLTPAVAVDAGIGVAVSSSTIDAQGGNLSIWGRSDAIGGAVGAAVTQSSLSGANIQVFGDTGATAGSTGVSIQTSALFATQSIDVRGVGGDRGVRIFGSNLVEDSVDLPMLEISPIGSGNLSIYGEGLRPDSIGVDINTTLASGVVPIVATGGATIEIYGQAPGTAIRIVDDNTFVQPTIEMTGGGSLTIGDARANSVRIDGASTTSEGATTLTATNALVLDNAAIIESIGPVSVFTQNLQTIADSLISSSDDGLGAIVLSGVDGNPMDSWASTADSLEAPAGRWLAYLTVVTDISAYPATTGLAYDFKLYNALPGDRAVDSYAGNGLVFSNPQFATVTGTVQSKAYDGTAVANVVPASVNVVGVNQDIATSIALSNASFSDANASINKRVSMDGISFTFQDANGKPVFGYTAQSALQGDITPRAVTVSGVTAENKTYDGNTVASLVGGSFTGLVGAETLTLLAAGQFDTKDAGTGKTVTGVLTLADGTNGGLASNYALPSDLVTSTADIVKATLSYVAEPAVGIAGRPLPVLSGTVAGLVGTDTVQDSTSGDLRFGSDVTSLSPPGRYAIFGNGLSAINYVFEQHPANASAFNLGSPAVLTAEEQGPTVMTEKVTRSVEEAKTKTKSAPGGLLNLTAVPPQTSATSSGGGANSGGGGGGGGFLLTVGSAQNELFESIDVSGQSQEVLAQVLADRDRYKKALFAEALDKLEKDPGLADQRPCLTLRDVERGSCLVTEALKREWLASEQSAAKAAISAAPADAVPASTPSPAPAKTTLAQAEPEQRASPVPGEAAAGMSATEAVALGITKRRVKEAALPQIDRKVALVIGVDNYDDPSIPRLSNAVKDARAVGRLLEAQLGYETIVLNNPGKTTVIAALNRLALTLQPSDSVVIYYAGHGEVVEATKLGYWQLADADAKRPETWLSNADIGKLVTQLGASQVALVSDSCYSGSLVSDERIRATAGTVDPAQVLARRSVVVMSSGGNEPVFDAGKNGHSPFAFSLMNSLGDLTSWQAGGNVFERVRFAVARELPQRPRYGANVAAGHSSGGDYLFERRQLDSSTQ